MEINPMILTKHQVKMLNDLAKTDWNAARAKLGAFNLAHGTDYGWLGKEVVWFETHDLHNVAERYAHCHDAYAWAK